MAGVAFVICLNDAIKAVVLDDPKKANKEMNRLKKEYKEVSHYQDEETFDHLAYWHTTEVPVLS